MLAAQAWSMSGYDPDYYRRCHSVWLFSNIAEASSLSAASIHRRSSSSSSSSDMAQPAGMPLQLFVRSDFQSASLSVEVAPDATLADLSIAVVAVLHKLHSSLSGLQQLIPPRMAFRHATRRLAGEETLRCIDVGVQHGDTLWLLVEGVGGLRAGSDTPGLSLPAARGDLPPAATSQPQSPSASLSVDDITQRLEQIAVVNTAAAPTAQDDSDSHVHKLSADLEAMQLQPSSAAVPDDLKTHEDSRGTAVSSAGAGAAASPSAAAASAAAPASSTDAFKSCAVCQTASHLCCNGCRAVYYCCREHQVKDWKQHKPRCHTASKAAAPESEYSIGVAPQVLLAAEIPRAATATFMPLLFATRPSPVEDTRSRSVVAAEKHMAERGRGRKERIVAIVDHTPAFQGMQKLDPKLLEVEHALETTIGAAMRAILQQGLPNKVAHT